MALSGIDDHHLIAKARKIKVNFSYFTSFENPDGSGRRPHRPSDPSGRRLIPEMVLCVLADLRIVRIADLPLIKEVIDDRADQHLKRSRRADAAALMTFVET